MGREHWDVVALLLIVGVMVVAVALLEGIVRPARVKTSGRWCVFVSGLIIVLTPGVASADAAAPTDYRSEIVAVTPAVDGLAVSIEGGDAFVRLTAPDGADVVVLGYAGEPYLWFAPDGAIATNQNSAATYMNVSRSGDHEMPDGIDTSAAPEWQTVGSGRTWAWHDHRSHWMGSDPPDDLERGEALPVQTIPITVDGRSVAITVETTLEPTPSRLPAALGMLIGLQLVVLGWYLGPATATLATLVVSVAATVTGVVQFASLPSETGPLHLWWAMPAVALLAGGAAIATYGRSDVLVRGLLVVSGVQLTIWALLRRTGLTKPVLPTDLAFWFDRAATGAALVGGAAVAILAIRSLVLNSLSPR